MVRRNHYRLIDTIISSLKESNPQVTYQKLSKNTNIKINSLKKWLKIINLIQTTSPVINLTMDGITIQSTSSNGYSDINTIRSQIKERDEDPRLNEFLNDFKGVLSRTKTSLENDNIKNYPQLNARSSHSKNLPQEYSDLQTELTQALEQGISFLKSTEDAETPKKSKTEGNFLQELKQAVNLGINNLEKVVLTDYREKRGRVNAMKSELELAFKAREERLKIKSNI
jgi:hypothetical protein